MFIFPQKFSFLKKQTIWKLTGHLFLLFLELSAEDDLNIVYSMLLQKNKWYFINDTNKFCCFCV
jgi:hypothetical protein